MSMFGHAHLAGSGKMKGGQDPIILRWTIFRNTFLWYHGKSRFKVAYSCLPREAGSQLVPVGTLFYPCKTGEIGILNMAQRQWGVLLLVHSVKFTQGNFRYCCYQRNTYLPLNIKIRRFVSSCQVSFVAFLQPFYPKWFSFHSYWNLLLILVIILYDKTNLIKVPLFRSGSCPISFFIILFNLWPWHFVIQSTAICSGRQACKKSLPPPRQSPGTRFCCCFVFFFSDHQGWSYIVTRYRIALYIQNGDMDS